MNRIVATLALAAALGATGALAENTTAENRARLADLWSKDSAATTRPVATAHQNFTGIGERTRQNFSGTWADNWRGGRKHPPAGR